MKKKYSLIEVAGVFAQLPEELSEEIVDQMISVTQAIPGLPAHVLSRTPAVKHISDI